MKLLVACFLAVIAMTAGTIVLEGAMKGYCQTGFFVVAGIAGFLLVTGRFE